jgi:hypothetical protein
VIIFIGFLLLFLIAFFQKDAGDIIFILLSVLYTFCYLTCIILVYRKDLKKMFIASILLCLSLLIIGIIFIQINNSREKGEEVKMIEEKL